MCRNSWNGTVVKLDGEWVAVEATAGAGVAGGAGLLHLEVDDIGVAVDRKGHELLLVAARCPLPPDLLA